MPYSIPNVHGSGKENYQDENLSFKEKRIFRRGTFSNPLPTKSFIFMQCFIVTTGTVARLLTSLNERHFLISTRRFLPKALISTNLPQLINVRWGISPNPSTFLRFNDSNVRDRRFLKYWGISSTSAISRREKRSLDVVRDSDESNALVLLVAERRN